tara:strand:- start:140 stop:493 length:354 start_codon:yes stop_codon:yes gene_type:complete
MLANILYFLFLVTPGVFLLLASTLYNEWWKNTIDKTNVQFLKENLDMLSHVVGSVLSALGMILITLNLGGSFNNEKLKSTEMTTRRKNTSKNYKNRQVRKDRQGRRYVLYDRKKRYF